MIRRVGADGALWFNEQMANKIGRAIPRRVIPTENALPYGIQMTAGVPFCCALGTHKIGSIDPKTIAIHDYDLPDECARSGN